MEEKATQAKAQDKTTFPKEKPKSKLPIILGTTIPIGIIIIIAALIFTGIIPLFDWELPFTEEEEQTTTVSDKEVSEAAEEEPEEIQLEYYPECEVSFEEGNTFEISQEGLDQGYPQFSFVYPDGWEIIEELHYDIGYLVLFKSPSFIELEVENIGPWEQPLIDERVIILNDEFSTMMPSEVVEHWYSYDVFNSPEIEILAYDNIDEEIFLVIWQEHGQKTWWVQYRFTQIQGYSFVHVVSAIDYCYDPWSDLLINSTIEERLVIEDKTVIEHVEEATEGPQATMPTIGLTIIEGPISEEGICYYRVQADTRGSPSPNITFNRDDSNGAWGADKAQINLSGPDDTFTITATAVNTAGSATDSITLAWGCEVPEEKPREEAKDEPKKEDPVEEEKCPRIVSIEGVSPGGSGSVYIDEGKWGDGRPTYYSIKTIINHPNLLNLHFVDKYGWPERPSSNNDDVDSCCNGFFDNIDSTNSIYNYDFEINNLSDYPTAKITITIDGGGCKVSESVTLTFYPIFID